MDGKVVPIGRANGNNKNNDSKLMLNFRRDISRIENQAAKECLMQAWRAASIIIFSEPPFPD
jgi:hypothetical protein